MAPPSPRGQAAGGPLTALGLFVGLVALCGMLAGYQELTRIQRAVLAEPAAPAAERPAGRQPLSSSLVFPEAQHLFDILDPATAACTKPLGAPLRVAGLQPALQACLGNSPACACVAWDEAAGTAQLGSTVSTQQQQQQQRSHSRQTVLAARRGCRQAPCAPPAAAGGGGNTQRGLEGCPPGMHELASDRGSLICNPCPGGYCGVLPGAELLPLAVLDSPLQAALASPPIAAAGQAGRPATSLHGINPSVFEWRGRRMVAARATNFGNCAAVDGPAAAGGGEAAGKGAAAAAQAARRRLAGEGGEGTAEEAEEKEKPPIFVNFVTLCDLGSAAEPVGRSPASRCRCECGGTLEGEAVHFGVPTIRIGCRTSLHSAPTCPARRLLPVNMAALAAQVPNMTLINEVQGVEDPRTFVHNGAAYLLVTLHLLGPETPQQRLAKGRKRLVSYPLAAAGVAAAGWLGSFLQACKGVCAAGVRSWRAGRRGGKVYAASACRFTKQVTVSETACSSPPMCPQWSDPGAPLHNFMAALRLNPALDAVDSGVVLRCEALNNTVRRQLCVLWLV